MPRAAPDRDHLCGLRNAAGGVETQPWRRESGDAARGPPPRKVKPHPVVHPIPSVGRGFASVNSSASNRPTTRRLVAGVVVPAVRVESSGVRTSSAASCIHPLLLRRGWRVRIRRFGIPVARSLFRRSLPRRRRRGMNGLGSEALTRPGRLAFDEWGEQRSPRPSGTRRTLRRCQTFRFGGDWLSMNGLGTEALTHPGETGCKLPRPGANRTGASGPGGGVSRPREGQVPWGLRGRLAAGRWPCWRPCS